MERVGLKLGDVTKRSRDNTANGTVLWQGTTAGTKVAKGSAVSIIACDNSTYTEYQPIITTTQTTTSTSDSLPGWTLTGYHYSDWSQAVPSSTRREERTYDGGTVTSEIYADPVYTNPYPYPTQTYIHGRDYGYREEIKWIQTALNYLTESVISVNGYYDYDTYTMVGSYQYYNGLSADSDAGPNTYASLDANFRSKAERERNYWYHYRTKIYDFSKTTTTVGEWTRTKPDGPCNTREVKVYAAY